MNCYRNVSTQFKFQNFIVGWLTVPVFKFRKKGPRERRNSKNPQHPKAIASSNLKRQDAQTGQLPTGEQRANQFHEHWDKSRDHSNGKLACEEEEKL